MRAHIIFARKIIHLLEIVTRTEITVRRRSQPAVRIKVHSDAVSDGRTMALYVDLVLKFCNFKPRNVFEIGANYAQDAEFLRQSFELNESDIHVFEPHPQIMRGIREFYRFNSHELAISNQNGEAVFHAIDVEENEYGNSGISSLKTGLTTDKRNFQDIKVRVVRMDDFIRDHKISEIDFLKLDVEGANYEVLEGFGPELSKVKVIQVEGEFKQYWEGQKLFWDIADLLRRYNFELAHFFLSGDGVQSDSLWIQKKYMIGA
jgi:FkbM family methyltransferase